ncbi:quinone-dependent dihydroorotate dehydrogenase [soil metagenome]
MMSAKDIGNASEAAYRVTNIYGRLYRPLITKVSPERAHTLALQGLRGLDWLAGGSTLLHQLRPETDDRLRLRVWDLPFANPLGVAAGLDKNGIAVEPLIALGFGHVEVGTVTLVPQAGNRRPRVWRVPEESAILNAMGFPNDGAAKLRHQLLPLRPQGVVGINIGKNRDTSPDCAAEEYGSLLAAVFEVAQYVTINVSSPNTPGLRALQMSDELSKILASARDANERTAAVMQRSPRPLMVKIAPDLTDAELEAVAEASVANGASGLVAINTTVSRHGIPETYSDYPGGLSGPPLRERANEVVKLLYRRVGGQIPIIGVGGISNGADAVARIRAGATLVQVYTAFIYAGPSLPGKILREMSADADRHGWRSVVDIVGSDAA